ncbi:MAG TPA: hypothetical protein VM912_19335, partial [Terriglobales bacterium]|nr:hypothetical protein [Terriglobales bacterium]
AAKIDTVLGDARLSLEREAANGELQRFDIFVVDAFSSDAIPVHLVTREAVALYLRHLSGANAVLAFHISNRFIDLKPVLLAISREQRLSSIDVHVKGSEWILMSINPEMLRLPDLIPVSEPLQTQQAFLWTDDFSNLTQVLP